MVYRGGFWSICRNSPKINVMSAATSRPSADLQAGAQHTDSPPAAPAAEVLIVDNDQAHAETVAESLQRVGFRTHVATSGGEGRPAGRGARVRRHHHRPEDERRRWPANPRAAKSVAARHGGHSAHRLRLDPFGRGGDAKRGFQLPYQAAGHGPASRGHATRGRQHAAAADEPRIEPPPRRAVRLRGRDRRQPPDARHYRKAQTHCPHQRHRAHSGRDGHWQGAGRPGDPSKQPPQEQAVRRLELRRA